MHHCAQHCVTKLHAMLRMMDTRWNSCAWCCRSKSRFIPPPWYKGWGWGWISFCYNISKKSQKSWASKQWDLWARFLHLYRPPKRSGLIPELTASISWFSSSSGRPVTSVNAVLASWPRDFCREAKREKKLVIWVFVSHSSLSNSLSFLSFRALRMLFAWPWSGSAFLPCQTLPWSCGQDSKLIYTLNFVLFHPPSSFRIYVLKCSCWSHERKLQHFKL